MRKIVPIFLIFLLICCVAYADDTYTTMYVLCKPGDYVNVRRSPSTNLEEQGRLECGDAVETDGKTAIDKQGRKWMHIVSPSFECGETWVCSMYVVETPITQDAVGGFIVSNGRTAIRRSPNGKRISWIYNGDEVLILAMSEEWVLTTRGYIMREYVDVYY